MAMSGNHKVLLDTNILIDIFGGNRNMTEKVNIYQKIYTSSIVLGELYTGINRVSNKSKQIKKLNEFLEWCTILEINQETAKYFGQLVAQLYKKGTPIPTNDVWIAASAMKYDLILMSGDKHFKQIESLNLEYIKN